MHYCISWQLLNPFPSFNLSLQGCCVSTFYHVWWLESNIIFCWKELVSGMRKMTAVVRSLIHAKHAHLDCLSRSSSGQSWCNVPWGIIHQLAFLQICTIHKCWQSCRQSLHLEPRKGVSRPPVTKDWGSNKATCKNISKCVEVQVQHAYKFAPTRICCAVSQKFPLILQETGHRVFSPMRGRILSTISAKVPIGRGRQTPNEHPRESDVSDNLWSDSFGGGA